MLDEARLRHVLELHEKSFALLKWAKSQLRQDKLSFSVIHDATDSPGAAAEWIRRHYDSFPPKGRPFLNDLATFSRLFVNFLLTSYRLNANSVRLGPGCRCSYCQYMMAGSNLDPRNPSKRDFQTAKELKQIYLKNLLAEQFCEPTHESVAQLLSHAELSEPISMATWGRELLRRAEFASQGEAVLALWREFAWEMQRARRNFQISSMRIIDAERKITAAITALNAPARH